MLGCCDDKKKPFELLQFDMDEDDFQRFKKAFIEVVEQPGMTYNVQEAFHTKGFFRVKETL